MNRIQRLLALIAFASCSVVSAADFPTLPNDTWYRVEVVIFERVGDVDAASRQEILATRTPRAFPLDIVAFDDDSNRAAAYPLDAETRAMPALPIVDAAAIAVNRSTQAQQTVARPPAPPAQPTPADQAAKAIVDYQSQLQDRAYRFEPSSTFLLAQEAGRLQRSSLYRLVFHRAWIQPVPDRDQLRPVLIQAGERIGMGWRIEGFLGVTRGRYLHMDTRLWYAADQTRETASGDAPPFASSDPAYTELREQRRMRSGELHYLDHPKFGVLARVDPVVPPESLVTELARLAAMSGQ